MTDMSDTYDEEQPAGEQSAGCSSSPARNDWTAR